jgi:putative heme transporter
MLDSAIETHRWLFVMSLNFDDQRCGTFDITSSSVVAARDPGGDLDGWVDGRPGRHRRSGVASSVWDARGSGLGVIALAALAVVGSMAAFARAQRRLLRVGGTDLHLAAVTAVTYAGNAISVSLPLAGAGAGTAFSFRQFRHRGADQAVASWALGMSGLISSFAFGVVLAAGALTSGNPAAGAFGLIGVVLSVAPGVVVLLALRHQPARQLISRVAVTLICGLSRLAKRPTAQPRPVVDSFLDRFAQISVPAVYFAEVFGLLLGNWVMDGLGLAFAIRATGAAIPWRGLFLAYGAGIGAAIVPLTPGGVGVVEVALSGALVAAGLHGPRSLAAVVVYRLISFWLVAAAGSVAFAALSRSGRADSKHLGDRGDEHKHRDFATKQGDDHVEAAA